jgi:hypothetical protein
LLALSVTYIVAVLVPAASGVNVTLIVQFWPDARAPQLFTSVKSAGLAPPNVIVDIVNGELPVLVKLADAGLLALPMVSAGKFKLVGERVAVVLPPLFEPAPVKVTTWGLSAALSVTVRFAARGPEAVGSKRMVMVQLELGCRSVLVLQLGGFELMLKSATFCPVI